MKKQSAKATKKKTKKTARQDYDSPWKDILEHFFEPCFEFFFPEAHAAIDWARGVEFLDKELQKLVAEAALGRRLADVLAKVYLRTGTELWVLVHVEVQGEPQDVFEERIYVYSFRGFNRYGRPVASFAILTDNDPDWRPREFSYSVLGTELRLKFPSVKLLDYAQDWDKLAASDNPFAIVVMTHLKALETRNSPQARYRRKVELVKGLYDRGFSAAYVRQLFFFIDWVLRLPDDLGRRFHRDMREFEEEKKMRYISSIERYGREDGLQEGLQQGRQEQTISLALRLLRLKLGSLSTRAEQRIQKLPLEKAEQLCAALLNFTTPRDLNVWLKEHAQ